MSVRSVTMLGEKIKNRREQLGFNQRDLARLLEISKGKVCELELGRTEPRLSLIEKMMEVLQVDSNFFLTSNQKKIHPANEEETSLMEYWRLIPDEEKPSVLLLVRRFATANEPKRRRCKSKELTPLIPMQPQKQSVKTFPIRLLVDVAAGQPIDAVRQPDEIDVPEKYARKNSVAARARGDSMINIGIEDRDIVVAESVRTSKNYKKGDVVIASIGGEEFTIKRYAGHRGGRRFLLPENDAYEIMEFADRDCQIEAVVIARKDKRGEWHDVKWASVSGRI